MLEVLAIAAAVHAMQPVQPGYLNRYQGTRNIAGCPIVPEINGRVWESDHAGHDTCETPGAAAYGAHDDGQTVYARVGELTIGISPWQRWNDESFPMHEAARQQWLKEQGYTGGVRTFVNDLSHAEGHVTQPREIRPHFIIPVPEDAVRFRSRMEVNAEQVRKALHRLGAMRVATTVVRTGGVADAR
ncbi:MAG: hypothetical protein SFY69_11420 [Planctomycetota bacterium]|nr:hypothetical protein [Planctomycetota bacterium]